MEGVVCGGWKARSQVWKTVLKRPQAGFDWTLTGSRTTLEKPPRGFLLSHFFSRFDNPRCRASRLCVQISTGPHSVRGAEDMY